MKNQQLLLAIFSTLCLSGLSFAQSNTSADNARKEPVSTGANQEQQRVAVVEFKPGDSQLSEESKAKIRSFADKARATGGIRKIQIAVWSDKPSSAEAYEGLSKEDRQLAELRGKNLVNYLKNELDIRMVDVINMAESTSWLAKKFNTEASTLKQAFSEKKFKGKMSSEALLIRDHGKPSSAVLVAVHDREKAAH